MTDRYDPAVKVLTPEWVCRVAGCNAVTLRAWRNRLGLFKPDPQWDIRPGSRKWNRFSVVEACVVRLIAVMTEHGFPASEAVGLAWSGGSPFGAWITIERLLKGHDVSPLLGFFLGSKHGPDDEVIVVADGEVERDRAANLPPSKSTMMHLASTDTIADLMKSTQGVVTLIDLREITRHVTDELRRSDVRKLVFGAIAAGLKPDIDEDDQ